MLGSTSALAAMVLQSASFPHSSTPRTHRMTARLLLIDDDVRLSAMVGDYLRGAGFEVETAGSLAAGRERLAADNFDALVLDLMLPDGDGLDLCRELRGQARTRHLPLLMLTARDSVEDRVRGLDVGADDYLAKPFAFAELFARLRAITRRESAPRPSIVEAGGLRIDPSEHSVHRGDTRIDLSPTEYSLLMEFARYPGRVRTRTQLIEHVWDFAYDGTSNVVDVYVRYLREKIDRPFDLSTIETVRGVGYRMRSVPVAASGQ